MAGPNKQIAVSGIQASGNLHIGNYIGAIKQFVELQDKYKMFVFVADLHAITVPQDPEKLQAQTLDAVYTYLACGLDPEKTTIFIQSHVPQHTELGWILNTITPLGELERMTQFKDKAKIDKNSLFDLEQLIRLENAKYKAIERSEGSIKEIKEIKIDITTTLSEILEELKNRGRTTAGLLNYPTLMAADILLYNPDAVPVGEDQLQHLEFARMVARKFNTRFGETFKEPKALIQKEGARIMGLDDPIKKMSKSATSANNYIGILDSEEEIRRKIKIAVTDSGKERKFYPKTKPAISNLLIIFSQMADIPVPGLEKKYAGKTYAEFKSDLADALVVALSPIQIKYKALTKDSESVLKILRNGADRARDAAALTMHAVRQKVGLLAH